MESCPVNAAAACDEGGTGVRWSITLKSWIFALTNYQWAIEECLSTPLENQLLLKEMSSVSPFAGLSSVLALALCDGEREQAIKELFMAFSAWANVPVCPTAACCAPQGMHHSWELLEHDWLVTSPARPKMPERLGSAVRAGPGNLLQGSKVAHSGARDPEPGQSLILL